MPIQSEVLNNVNVDLGEGIKLYDKAGNHKVTVLNCDHTACCIDVVTVHGDVAYCGELNESMKSFLEVLKENI